MVHPGRLSRREALIERGMVSVKLAIGAAAMLMVAALIEAYWSPSPHVPRDIKMIVGGLLWLLVIGWLGLAGSGRLVGLSAVFHGSEVVAADSANAASARDHSGDEKTEPTA